MFEYPHILGPNKAPRLPCVAFEKIDGSNLRFEYSKKRGWYKFGTRQCLFDETDNVFGCAISAFKQKYEHIAEIIKKQKRYRNISTITAFAEFYGQSSFCGWHSLDEQHDVVLFDIYMPEIGFLSPSDFLDIFYGVVDIPEVLYTGYLNASFVDDVKSGKYTINSRTSLFEGVVCKGVYNGALWMRKIKTEQYIACLKNAHGDKWIEFAE